MNAMTSSRSRSVGKVLAIMAICRPGISLRIRAAHAVAEVRELPLYIGGVETRESRRLQRRISFGLAAMASTAFALIEIVAVAQVAARGRCIDSLRKARDIARDLRDGRVVAESPSQRLASALRACRTCERRDGWFRKLRSWRSRYAASWPAMAGALSAGLPSPLLPWHAAHGAYSFAPSVAKEAALHTSNRMPKAIVRDLIRRNRMLRRESK